MAAPQRKLQALPRIEDSLSWVYLEHCTIEQSSYGVVARDATRITPLPIASLTSIILGPGTSVTHGAIKLLAEAGCGVNWTGADGARFYAAGLGDSRKSDNLLHQARSWASPDERLRVVRRMYALRFGDLPSPDASLEQLRGLEGARVRNEYQMLASQFGVPWSGRSYKRDNWSAADPINRLISSANATLYGLVHAVVATLGLSPALGFVHTGKALSFVYDIADLYKHISSLPAAFEVAAQNGDDSEARRVLRRKVIETRLMSRIPKDIASVLALHMASTSDQADPVGDLWSGDRDVPRGTNY